MSFGIGGCLGVTPQGIEVDPLAANTRTQKKSRCPHFRAQKMYQIRVDFYRTICQKNASLEIQRPLFLSPPDRRTREILNAATGVDLWTHGQTYEKHTDEPPSVGGKFL